MNTVRLLLSGLALLVLGCSSTAPAPPPTRPVQVPASSPSPNPEPRPQVTIRIGVALGGGAAKGFAHIGVIKMLEANGLVPDVVAGTSAGSVVGALYAGGMDVFKLQQHAVGLDEARIRDVSLFSGGLIKGEKLQTYVNEMLEQRPFERLRKPFAVVATRLETGERAVFVRGNVGQAVRASCSIPGVFEPLKIGTRSYVDGGLVSPVPVDAARQLGADFVIAIDISSKADGQTPDSMLGVLNQSITIMGQKLGQQELARADVIIRPKVNDIGPVAFEQRSNAILEGERAALQALPQIRAKLARLREAKVQAEMTRIARERAARAARERATRPVPANTQPCEDPGFLGGLLGGRTDCQPTDKR